MCKRNLFLTSLSTGSKSLRKNTSVMATLSGIPIGRKPHTPRQRVTYSQGSIPRRRWAVYVERTHNLWSPLGIHWAPPLPACDAPVHNPSFCHFPITLSWISCRCSVAEACGTAPFPPLVIRIAVRQFSDKCARELSSCLGLGALKRVPGPEVALVTGSPLWPYHECQGKWGI